MKFAERPLKDVIASLGKRHKINIALDKTHLDDAGIPDDVQMTREMAGISLHSALRLLLADLGLTYVCRGEVLYVTTLEEAQRLVHEDVIGERLPDDVSANVARFRLRKAAIDPAEYWKSSQVAAASRKKVAEALEEAGRGGVRRCASLGRDPLPEKGRRD